MVGSSVTFSDPKAEDKLDLLRKSVVEPVCGIRINDSVGWLGWKMILRVQKRSIPLVNMIQCLNRSVEPLEDDGCADDKELIGIQMHKIEMGIRCLGSSQAECVHSI